MSTRRHTRLCTLFLCVDKPHFKTRPRNVQGEIGQNIMLLCEVDSNPPATIEWTHEKTNKVSSVI